MYDLHGQGIPLIMLIDQAAVVRAVKLDSKINGSMYAHFGENVTALKQDIAREISRGISSGQSWHRIAKNITHNMMGDYKNPKGAYAYVMMISRTEGHRIQIQSTMDAQKKAKDSGADIVKQWDAALDGRTRTTHRQLDGQIRELDEDFEISGMKVKAPGYFGRPSEECNCRCALLQRARWALDEEELNTLKDRAEYFGLDKTKDFDDFQKKYLNIAKKDFNATITDIDKRAIYDYMSAKSYVINEKLRTGLRLSNEEQEFVNNLDNALEKLPKYKGNLQRSLYFSSDDDIESFMSRHKIGDTVQYDEYISTTNEKIYNPEGQVQIYIQDSENGKDMSSFNYVESEILYKRGSSFSIINVVKRDGKYYILVVEENE